MRNRLLVRLLYQYIPPENDRRHLRAWRQRQNDAEQFRGEVVSILLALPGPEAQHELESLAGDPDLKRWRDYFLFLGEQHAAQDAEGLPWTPAQVQDFGSLHLRDPRTQGELFQLIVDHLDDLRERVENGHFSDRSLFSKDSSEDDIQKWLATRLHEVARGRFSVHREEEIEPNNAPDITISHPHSGKLAIEIKPVHKYSYLELKKALEDQLIAKYLTPVKAGYGILFLAQAADHAWDLPDGTSTRDLNVLVGLLQDVSKEQIRQFSHLVEIRIATVDLRVATSGK